MSYEDNPDELNEKLFPVECSIDDVDNTVTAEDLLALNYVSLDTSAKQDQDFLQTLELFNLTEAEISTPSSSTTSNENHKLSKISTDETNVGTPDTDLLLMQNGESVSKEFKEEPFTVECSIDFSDNPMASEITTDETKIGTTDFDLLLMQNAESVSGEFKEEPFTVECSIDFSDNPTTAEITADDNDGFDPFMIQNTHSEELLMEESARCTIGTDLPITAEDALMVIDFTCKNTAVDIVKSGENFPPPLQFFDASESAFARNIFGNRRKQELRVILQRCDFGNENIKSNLTGLKKLKEQNEKFSNLVKVKTTKLIPPSKRKNYVACGKKFKNKRCAFSVEGCKPCRGNLKIKKGKRRVPNKNYKKKKIKKKPLKDVMKNVCSWCDLNFVKLQNLKIHQEQSKSYLKIPTCTVCEKNFDYKCQLRRHYEADHNGEKKRFICKECGMKFHAGSALKRHTLTHTELLPYCCPDCAKRFRRKEHLTAHMVEVHPKEFNHICEMCEQVFKSQKKLAQHMIIHTGVGILPCPHCPKSLNSKRGMARHMATHQEKKFICKETECGKAFYSKGYLRRHKARHATERNFSCEFCYTTFKTKANHLKHYNRSSCGANLPFKCHVCRKGYIELDKLREHEMTHTGKYIFKCDYPDCRKFFKYRKRFTAHINSAHAEEPVEVKVDRRVYGTEILKRQPYVQLQRLHLGKTRIQPKWFKYFNGYCYLKKRTAKNVWYWRCSELLTLNCRATLIEDLITMDMYRGLKKHNHPPDPMKQILGNCEPEGNEASPITILDTTSEGAKLDPVPLEKLTGESTDGFFVGKKKKRISRKCPHCKKTFWKKSGWLTHQRVHTGKKRFTCQFCDKKLTTSGGLLSHIRTHTKEKPYKCHHCDYRAITSAQVKMHVLHNHTENAPRPFKCDQCEKAFTSRQPLRRHYRLHTGEKPYECEFCQKRFTQSGNLNIHRRSHTGDKSHKCDFCEYASTSSSGLRSHEHLVHPSEMPYQCDECDVGFTKISGLKRHKKNCHYSNDNP